MLYANSFAVPFLFDDQIEILNNPKIKELNGPLFYLTQSRGIVLLSLALNHSWGGLNKYEAIPRSLPSAESRS